MNVSGGQMARWPDYQVARCSHPSLAPTVHFGAGQLWAYLGIFGKDIVAHTLSFSSWHLWRLVLKKGFRDIFCFLSFGQNFQWRKHQKMSTTEQESVSDWLWRKRCFWWTVSSGDKVTKPNFVESKYGRGVLLAFGWGWVCLVSSLREGVPA